MVILQLMMALANDVRSTIDSEANDSELLV